VELYRLLAESRAESRAKRQKVHEEVQSIKETVSHWEGEMKSTQALAGNAVNVSSQCQNFITKEFLQIVDQFRTELEPKQVRQEEASASTSQDGDDCPRRPILQASCANVALISSNNSSGRLTRCSSTTDASGLIACDNFPRQMAFGLLRALTPKDKMLSGNLGNASVPNTGSSAITEQGFGWTRACVTRGSE